MNLSSLFKQLKRRLRLKRRWLALGLFIVAIAASGAVSLTKARKADGPGGGTDVREAIAASGTMHRLETRDPAGQQEVLQRIREAGGKRDVYLHKAYVCGEETKLLGTMGTEEIMSLHNEYPQWAVELAENGRVTFTETIDDLSPACKEHAYFGLDKNGNLSLFNGPPEGEVVIRTFFQLNMGYLESSLPKETVNQLKEGIRVADMAEYNSVLSTFSDFAVEETEKVMQSAG